MDRWMIGIAYIFSPGIWVELVPHVELDWPYVGVCSEMPRFSAVQSWVNSRISRFLGRDPIFSQIFVEMLWGHGPAPRSKIPVVKFYDPITDLEARYRSQQRCRKARKARKFGDVSGFDQSLDTSRFFLRDSLLCVVQLKGVFWIQTILSNYSSAKCLFHSLQVDFCIKNAPWCMAGDVQATKTGI